MKLRIHCDRESLEKSLMCGQFVPTNCWVAVAVRDIFPNACVGYNTINIGMGIDGAIDMPRFVEGKIREFDRSSLFDRLNLEPFSFEIDVPEEVINTIGINEVERILSESKTLERV